MTRTQRRYATSYRHVRIRRGESRHHRKMRCHNGSNHPSNISVVPKSKHAYFHALFGSMTPDQIADEMNNVWLDRDFIFVCYRVEKDTYERR